MAKSTNNEKQKPEKFTPIPFFALDPIYPVHHTSVAQGLAGR
jgi:hypothetical protein